MTTAHPIGEAAPTSAHAAGRLADLVPLGLLYALAQAHLLLVGDAVFWDDWVLAGSRESVARMFYQASALPVITWMHFVLMELGMWSYKAITFVLWFASGLLLDRILARNSLFTTGARFAVVLLYLLLPLNSARVAGITLPYTVCAFFFMLGWDQMERRRLVALASFALSFVTSSHLVFYALPILDAAWRGGHLASPRAAVMFAVRRLDFFLLPFAYFAWHVATFVPKGPYADYNSHYGLHYIGPVLKQQAADARLALRQLDVLLTLLLLGPVWWLLARSTSLRTPTPDAPILRKLAWLGVGVLAFVLGGFAYWVINKVPTFAEWDSRHQLLLPLGTATVLVALVWLLPQRARVGVLALLVSVCLSMAAWTGYSFWLDARKQQAVIDLLARDASIRSGTVVVFVDTTKSLNAIGRDYRMYEWNGLLAQAFGDETRVGGDARDIKTYLEGGLDKVLHLHYRSTQHRRTPAPPIVLAEIRSEPAGQGGQRKLRKWKPMPQLTLHTRPVTPEAVRAMAGS